MLGKLEGDSQFHLQIVRYQPGKWEIKGTKTNRSDIIVPPIFSDFGLEPPCLGESHAWARIARTDMFSQQRAVSELTRWDQMGLKIGLEQGTHL